MALNPEFKIGDQVLHKNIISAFKCGNMGGMLPSNKTKTMVIISDYTKGLYHDKWKSGVLHYTGTGKVGDQQITGNPGYKNGILYNSKTNGMEIHLFEVLESAVYTYCGVVVLDADPYQEMQKDDNAKDRKVWMFPMRPVNDISSIIPESQKNLQIQNQVTKKKIAEIEKRADLELLEEVESAQENELPAIVDYIPVPVNRPDPVMHEGNTSYPRNKDTSLKALKRANYACEIDVSHPSFIRKSNGTNYTEPHHLVPMAEQGRFECSLDVQANIVSLCSNCHKRLHYGKDPELLLKQLYEERKEELKAAGITISYKELLAMYK